MLPLRVQFRTRFNRFHTIASQRSMSISVGFEERSDGRVATVTIRNARALNTLNSALLTQFVAAFAELSQDEKLRCVVLAAEGAKAWVGGADIKEMAKIKAPSEARDFIRKVHGACQAVRSCPVPVIARIQGFTLGGGLELAAACDFRVATEGSVFGMPEVKVGLPSVVEAALLPHLIGWGRARYLVLTGANINAATAISWGLIEFLVPDEASLDAKVSECVDHILSSGPRAVRLQKELVARWEELGVRAAVEEGVKAFGRAYEGDEPRRYMDKTFFGRKQGDGHEKL
ncbi:putative enoyl-CoA hydratase [Gonapodya prolifera JEL478]|uniref:Putative enoyl-CoA hydratase n=1 Tax=Gonapodya prolifera (strain JEL478) TaxID=1344416 RepID=A0A139AFA6_GONPJ|nr:putative enoyl-CoA hydratase [Gonapodya prolifera JEL478]|eukprot:KXS15512.1 putative enoyl-CoA hydratase [Gonapodya prolifera JEL478]